MKKIKIKHIDGRTDVLAKIIFGNKDINLEYRFQGMTYGRTLSIIEAVKMGIVECPHDNVLPILGYENSIVGEVCQICGKEMMHNEQKDERSVATKMPNAVKLGQ